MKALGLCLLHFRFRSVGFLSCTCQLGLHPLWDPYPLLISQFFDSNVEFHVGAAQHSTVLYCNVPLLSLALRSRV